MSELVIKGTIISIGQVDEIPKKDGSGVIKKLQFAVKGEGQYPKDAAFLIKQDSIIEKFHQYNKVGKEVNVKFNVESREWNGKWYTDLVAWRIESVGENSQQPQQEQTPKPSESAPTPEGDEDQLPF